MLLCLQCEHPDKIWERGAQGFLPAPLPLYDTNTEGRKADRAGKENANASKLFSELMIVPMIKGQQ